MKREGSGCGRYVLTGILLIVLSLAGIVFIIFSKEILPLISRLRMPN
jgi:hypothetical protein